MRIYQVDAFTDEPFRGNPAAVVVLGAERPDAWLQALAAELRLSETAYLTRGERGWGLRWFTPATEVGLCGHATLASAHVLWEEGLVPLDESTRFQTRAGLLTARFEVGGWVAMDFPAREVSPAEPYPALNAALGVDPIETAMARRPNGDTYLLEVASEEEVRGAAPDAAAILGTSARTVILTARAAGGGVDFVSRFFAPAIGIPEDPVTGSAHCYLAPYWARRLGRADLLGYQASARGGTVGCRWEGERVTLRGRAVTISRGEILA